MCYTENQNYLQKKNARNKILKNKGKYAYFGPNNITQCVKIVLTFMTRCVIFNQLDSSEQKILQQKTTNVKPEFCNARR